MDGAVDGVGSHTRHGGDAGAFPDAAERLTLLNAVRCSLVSWLLGSLLPPVGP